jgi:hypothetical protein
VFDSVDVNRTFNPTQRRIFWHSSRYRECYWCHTPISRWEDLAIDHVQPYIKGGRTNLKNGQLMHKKCNSEKGAK